MHWAPSTKYTYHHVTQKSKCIAELIILQISAGSAKNRVHFLHTKKQFADYFCRTCTCRSWKGLSCLLLSSLGLATFALAAEFINTFFHFCVFLPLQEEVFSWHFLWKKLLQNKLFWDFFFNGACFMLERKVLLVLSGDDKVKNAFWVIKI